MSGDFFNGWDEDGEPDKRTAGVPEGTDNSDCDSDSDVPDPTVFPAGDDMKEGIVMSDLIDRNNLIEKLQWAKVPSSNGYVLRLIHGGEPYDLEAADALEAKDQRIAQLEAALRFYANEDSYPDARLHQLTAVATAALENSDE